MTCIYRHINTGRSCCFKAKSNNYCNLHSNNRNLIYTIIDNSTDNKEQLTINDIYKIYRYIKTTDNIYLKDLIFTTILRNIYIKNCFLINLYHQYPLINDNNHNNLHNRITEINKRTFEIEQSLSTTIIKKIQLLSKIIIIKPHIYRHSIKDAINNTTDPFTLEEINQINKNERFIYKDDNNYYCFKATELLYFIEDKGNNWNPYTKKEFSLKLKRNLKIFIDYFNLINNNNYSWNTTQQAFTDVSQLLEKIGFYTNPDWFLKLTTKQITNTIRLFKVISVSTQENSNYFKDSQINENSIYFDFAREIIRLFEDGNSHFLLCCNFMKAISVYSNDFYSNLPEWLYDIQSSVVITTPNQRGRTTRILDIIYLINIIDE